MPGGENGSGNGSSHPLLPSDEDAEDAVLGAALVSEEAARVVTADLHEDSFTREWRRCIFRSVGRLVGKGQHVDIITVAADLSHHGELSTKEDPKRPDPLRLHALAESVALPAAAPQYAQILAGHAQRRRIVLLASDVQRRMADPTTEPEAVFAELSLAAPEIQVASRMFSGTTFALSERAVLESVWGRGSEVLWAGGEPLLIASPTGVGKTTLANRLMLARLGVGSEEILGFPVSEADRPILYIAADRPRQASRSLRRMIEAAGAEEYSLLEDFLMVHAGPLGWDIARDQGRLYAWTKQLGVGTVVIDSLKDVASELTKEETGQGLHAAFSELVANDIEVLALHHQRKSTPDNRKPRTIDDIYGSTYITAGAGSVVLLWGKAGDPVFALDHLKQPADDVGPLQVRVDHETGALSRVHKADPVAILRQSPQGLSAREAAVAIFDTTDPSEAEVEKARRRLRSLESAGQAMRQEIGTGRGHSARWFATTQQQELHAPQEELL
jgi:replicative DNA helicase